MSEASDTMGILHQNLIDAGCSEDLTRTCMELAKASYFPQSLRNYFGGRYVYAKERTRQITRYRRMRSVWCSQGAGGRSVCTDNGRERFSDDCI